MTRVGKSLLGVGLLLLTGGSAYAQVMPPPKKAPRIPVKTQTLAQQKTAPTPLGVLEGQATVLDAERLRLEGYDLRLYGVVVPQAGASYGPQARAALDALAQGTAITCQVKDRDREGRLLAICQNAERQDFGLELLRRGLAVSARGTLQDSTYAPLYFATEQAAQTQRLGLWSASVPQAASDKSVRDAAAKAAAAKAEVERLKQEEEAAKQEAQDLLSRKNIAPPEPAQNTVPPLEATLTTEEANAPLLLEGDADQTPFAEPVTLQTLNTLLSQMREDAAALSENKSFFERYQLLLTGFLFFLATLVALGGAMIMQQRQRNEALRSLAAALRGELMAARSICQARLAKIAQDEGEKDARWPRLRTLVFQAHVGRLGLLGAELSRQIASIYGQASDCASYYNAGEKKSDISSMRQALETLVHHIGNVGPRLALLEKEGTQTPQKLLTLSVFLPRLFFNKDKALASSTAVESVADNALPSPPLSPPPSGGGTPRPLPATTATEPSLSPALAATLSEAKAEVTTEAMAHKAPSSLPSSKRETPPLTQTRNTAPIKDVIAAASPSPRLSSQKATVPPRPALADRIIPPAPPKAAAVRAGVNFKVPLMERLARLKAIGAAVRKESGEETTECFPIPDYTNLTEEELEALLFAEDSAVTHPPSAAGRKTG